MSEASDWYLIPVEKQEKWYMDAMFDEPPEWADYVVLDDLRFPDA